ncbi:MAG: GDSL-type esterase/lipase family protein, partial [Pseudomonadota bacterium]|nr:GDSL-type esterase/lipase family protein [Pseudomonadota bacterium]
MAALPALADTRLLVLGDSLVAGYGLPPGQSFPAQLERDLKASGRDVTVINAGVSGDTTAGGLARLDWSLADNPQAVIIVLGGNDMLRGLPPE